MYNEQHAHKDAKRLCCVCVCELGHLVPHHTSSATYRLRSGSNKIVEMRRKVAVFAVVGAEELPRVVQRLISCRLLGAVDAIDKIPNVTRALAASRSRCKVPTTTGSYWRRIIRRGRTVLSGGRVNVVFGGRLGTRHRR